MVSLALGTAILCWCSREFEFQDDTAHAQNLVVKGLGSWTCLQNDVECLFCESLDKFIKEVTADKVLLSPNKQPKPTMIMATTSFHQKGSFLFLPGILLCLTQVCLFFCCMPWISKPTKPTQKPSAWGGNPFPCWRLHLNLLELWVWTIVSSGYKI